MRFLLRLNKKDQKKKSIILQEKVTLPSTRILLHHLLHLLETRLSTLTHLHHLLRLPEASLRHTTSQRKVTHPSIPIPLRLLHHLPEARLRTLSAKLRGSAAPMVRLTTL